MFHRLVMSGHLCGCLVWTMLLLAQVLMWICYASTGTLRRVFPSPQISRRFSILWFNHSAYRTLQNVINNITNGILDEVFIMLLSWNQLTDPFNACESAWSVCGCVSYGDDHRRAQRDSRPATACSTGHREGNDPHHRRARSQHTDRP